MIDLGHWQIGANVNPAEFETSAGFIYLITNNLTGRKYIGRKQLHFVRTLPPLKGQRRKRKKKIESDWRVYTSSCPDLRRDIETIGAQHFTFTIIKLCPDLYSLKYEEAKAILEADAILSHEFYNGNIMIRLPARKPKVA